MKNLFHKEKACGIIIEKQTNNIIASCSDQAYFKKTEDGEYKRLKIHEFQDKRMLRAYEEYLENKTTSYKINKDNRDLHIRVTDYENDGIEWIVLTLLPESPMQASVKNSIKLGLGLTILVVLVSSFIFFRAMKSYMDPINRLMEAQKAFAQGDLLKRVEIKRKDEIGSLTSSFNAMADMIYSLVNKLEKKVEERTQELKESRDYLETTLLSVGDGIITIDEKGNITLMNPVTEKLTGWSSEEAYGRPIEEILLAICEEEGEIYKNPANKSLLDGKTMEGSGQPMLVCKSQKKIYVEYTAAPIKNKENKPIGSVIVFKDITDEKRHLDKIEYLSKYDQLTGLYNRWHMEEELERLDREECLPLTIMLVDINGLKLVNDAFGHEKGDQLLRAVSRILKNVLRKEDIIGRVCGDEFLILLPRVNEKGAKLLKKRISKAILLEDLEPVVISIAIGYSIRKEINQSIKEIRIDADNKMYENKILYGKNMRKQTIERVLKNINYKYDQEEIHGKRVAQYCEALGKAMGFSKYEVEDLKIIGRLHDIGKIVVPPDLLSQAEKLTEEELDLIKKHPETGYHRLKSVDEYMGLAEDILYHHEKWDGTGYPKGLKGKEIPINSRIVAVADAYEAMTAKRPYTKTKTKEEAIKELEKCAGSQFDPDIVRIFIEKVLK